MSDKWFYTHQGKMCGPVTADELNELAETGRLLEKDLIWRVESSPKDAVRAGKHLIFFLAGGTPTPPPVEEAPPMATPAPAPAWLTELADVAEEFPDSPQPSGAASPDWLQDVRNAEKASKPPNEK